MQLEITLFEQYNTVLVEYISCVVFISQEGVNVFLRFLVATTDLWKRSSLTSARFFFDTLLMEEDF